MATTIEVAVPDIGDFTDIPVIEILVQVGDQVSLDDPLLTLESDKATMDVPAPQAGTVAALHVAVGDTVSEGSVLLSLTLTESDAEVTAQPSADASAALTPGDSALGSATPAAPEAPAAGAENHAPTDPESVPPGPMEPADPDDVPAKAPALSGAAPGRRGSPTDALPDLPGRRQGTFHATPSVRRFARELGVDLSQVRGTGRKGRIVREDVSRFVKSTLANASNSAANASGGAGIPAIPAIDFSRYGEIELRPLSRIKRATGSNLHRAWLNVPLVTHRDEADITELEDFRQSLREEASQRGVRVTVLAFIIKAMVAALKAFPTFNASLAPDGESLILKKYFHIGIAVDTPNGLVVPVIRDADGKSVFELADEMGQLSERAREGQLKVADMSGGCISISSLGGIGGTAFTPLVNAPEVAILGVARSKMRPEWNGSEFVPRLMLPLCLSYDHRVIDGAEGARFVAFLARNLADVRRLLL